MRAAWKHAQHLMARSRENRRVSHQTRSATHSIVGRHPGDDVVWRSPDDVIRCRIVQHSPDAYQLIITVNGDVMWSRSFADRIDAEDESMRVRRVFLE